MPMELDECVKRSEKGVDSAAKNEIEIERDREWDEKDNDYVVR